MCVQKAKGAPVLEKTLGYNIWYFPENNTNLAETTNTTNQQLELYLGDKAYWVSVISYNSLGESPVAVLRIPAIDEKCGKAKGYLPVAENKVTHGSGRHLLTKKGEITQTPRVQEWSLIY